MTKKKVLIVGSGSYIGTSFANDCKDVFDICVLDSTKELTVSDYVGFDSVLHVAGIAHVSKKKSMRDLYYKVNRDLAIHSAELAKQAGVKQFIFMSSMIIFGGDNRVGSTKLIDKDTKPNPVDFYGDSKLQADLAIQKMNCDTFKTLIIRTPMVYGPGCKGNYPRLQKLAIKTPILPKLENQRTVIEIHNLTKFFQKYMENGTSGVLYPRDEKPFVTYKVMVDARTSVGKKTHLTKIFNPLIIFFSLFFVAFRKMFGSKIYSNDLPE